MYQFPAGGISKGEEPGLAAKRELQEETGYIAGGIQFICKSAAYPTKLSGWHHLYLATNVTKKFQLQDDQHEPTRVVLKTQEELWSMICDNEFQVADSLIAALIVFKSSFN